jgi:hypothetical protein
MGWFSFLLQRERVHGKSFFLTNREAATRSPSAAAYASGKSCNTHLSAFGMMPSRMFLASRNDSLVLRDNGEHPPRKTPFQDNPCQERIAYLAMGEQLFLVW